MPEFNIRAGKVYLLLMIDCFDGMAVYWRIGVSPNAKLVNGMLKNAVLKHRDGRTSYFAYGSWLPLPLAGLDQENDGVEAHKIHVKEGLLSR